MQLKKVSETENTPLPWYGDTCGSGVFISRNLSAFKLCALTALVLQILSVRTCTPRETMTTRVSMVKPSTIGLNPDWTTSL